MKLPKDDAEEFIPLPETPAVTKPEPTHPGVTRPRQSRARRT